MKNAFKFGFLALAISLSVAACQSSEKTGEATDSTAVDTTAAAVPAVDTTATDTAAKDTTVKAETPAH